MKNTFRLCYKILLWRQGDNAPTINIKTKEWQRFYKLSQKEFCAQFEPWGKPEINKKVIERLLRRDDIELIDNTYIIYKYKCCPQKTNYRWHKPNIVLKQESKRKLKNKALDNSYWPKTRERKKPPHLRDKEPTDYGFDEVSSNVFGHPNLRYTLEKKKQAKGYRRAVEKQKGDFE